MKMNGNEISTKMNKRRRNEIENLFILAKKHNIAHLILKGNDIEFMFWDKEETEKVPSLSLVDNEDIIEKRSVSMKQKEDERNKEKLELELWSSGR